MKKTFEPYKVALLIIIYIGIAWLINLPLNMLGLSSVVLFLVILFVVVEVFYRISKVNLEYLFVAAAIIRLVFDYKTVYTAEFFLTMSATVIVFLVFHFFFLDLAFKANTRAVKISALKPGMKLAEGIMKMKDGSYERKRIIHFTAYDILRWGISERFVHTTSDEGLTKDDVDRIKSLRKSGKLDFDVIHVHISVPFAAFLFFGFLLTVVMNGNFATFLKNILASY